MIDSLVADNLNKRYRDPSDSGRRDSNDDTDDVPDREKGRGYRRKRKDRRRVSRQDRNSHPDDSSADSFATSLECSDRLTRSTDSDSDDDNPQQRRRLSKRLMIRALKELFI